MRSAAAVTALCLLATAGTAAAKPAWVEPDVVEPEVVEPDVVVVPVPDAQGLVIAGDAQPAPPPEPEPVDVIARPPPPYDDPYQEPYGLPPTPYPDDHVPHESSFLMASVVHGWLSGRDGVGSFGDGGALTLGFVQRDGDFPTGADLSAVLVRGPGGAVYDLSVRVIGSPKIGRRVLVPFVAIGLCAGASRIEGDSGPKMADAGDDDSWGLALGPTAALGLHGFLSDTLYWRAQTGFLGAGAGLLTADVALGFVMD